MSAVHMQLKEMNGGVQVYNEGMSKGYGWK
jgi:hypothetical protein